MIEQLETRVARIESDVQDINADTADLRVELRRTNDKTDATDKRIEEVRNSLKDEIHSLTVRALLLLCFAITAALFAGLAKGFKWI